ncbi:AraC family transcriptional regulator [Paenibacillus sacheonensis]|uniref:Helix-turn-helix domain-containing protein n=1 Tax=Paenibacillus sacheonensis TaxID=742054 RepID=A0A7X4YQU2_9BACL|nr:AraC family transcriptional regulator [Paenibacillus sacheonensis]MBM7567225.1 AraC-like DNA-binding protein [Paenibacillus sacheonensis]NBC70850.1 helix-turn-helix domain-containing protein [Paenibacillus sacheonensis]
MRVNYEGIEITIMGAGRITPDSEWNIAPHKHDQYEIHFITEGIGRNQLENGEMELYPGIVYMAPPQEMHAQYSDKTSPLGLYYVFLDLKFPPHWEPLSRIYAPFSFSSGDLLSIFESIGSPAVDASIGNRLLGNMRLIEMVWKVLESRLQSVIPASPAQPLNQHGQPTLLLQNAVLYIQQHFYRNPTVAEIAEACYVSERHLSRMFLRHMNMTVNQFVQHQRLFYASTELKHTNSSLQAISERLQFSSMQYFAQWFKGLSSMTPAEFRKKHFIA